MKENRDALLIFDLDGVLVDSEPLSARVLVKCLQEDGFNVDDAFGKSCIGFAFKDTLVRIENEFNRTVSDGFTQTLSDQTAEEIKSSLLPVSQIEEALRQLPNLKCVASGSDHFRINLSLEVTGLLQYFPHIYSAYDVPNGKPAPDVFLFAAKNLNYDPQHCIVIEDSNAGMQAGIAANMKVLLYTPEGESHFEVPEQVTTFSCMSQLPLLVGRLSEQ